MQTALYQLFLIDNHVIPQIIKSKFIICDICNITVIGITSLVIAHIIKHNADCQSKKFMDLSHPLGVTLCQVIIYRNDTDTLSFQGI